MQQAIEAMTKLGLAVEQARKDVEAYLAAKEAQDKEILKPQIHTNQWNHKARRN